MIPYPSYGAKQNNAQRSGGKLIQAVSKPIAGTRAPLLPKQSSPTAPTHAPYNPGKPILGADPVQQIDVPSSGGISYGGYQDPAIAQMAAMAAKAAAIAARTRSEAQAQATAARNQATIEYGDASGVPNIDQATAQAASANPFSILKALERDYTTGTNSLEDQLNKANLFYGGYRGQQLGQAATDYQQQRYGAGTRYQATLNDINSQLTQALLNADMMDMQAGVYGGGGGETFNAFGQVTNDPGTGVGRPGEWADLPVLKGWDPNKNSDAQYDLSAATPAGDGTFIGPNGARYDDHGRRI